MTLVASTIPNLVTGVSQQPAPSRLRTSGEEIINGYPSIVSGLMKRAPSEFIEQLSPSITVSDTSAVHMIDRDADEKYILICGESDLELYDLQGVKQTVTFPDGKGYLPSSDMWKKLRFATVADTTFISNSEVTVTTSSPSESRTNPQTRASIFVKQAVASVAYAVYVDGVLAATMTTSANVSAATALEGTTDIAEQLVTDAIAKGYTDAVNFGPVVTFTVTAGQEVTVDDQFGGTALEVYTDTLQEFSDLPPFEEGGRLVRIEGNLDDLGTSYWVEYQANGVWKEVVGYDERRRVDADTMPHVLVKTAPNTFEFRENNWEDRPAGDDDSNPDPTFVGSGINSLFLFKGRLGFLSEENVVLTSVGNFEQVYRTTVIQLLASDVIDVASTTGRVSTLYHAVSFSDELVLFSDKQQFRLSSGTILSAETVGITNSTTYPCSTLVAPVAVGSSAYFVSDGATNSLSREIFIDAERSTVNGEDIAVQVPRYIPNNIRTLAASNDDDLLVALSADTPNELYVYKWYDTGRRKVQSAWCRWVFDENVNIVGVGFLDSYLYMVYRVGSDIRFDRLLVGPTIERDLLLDHQFDHTSFTTFTYDVGTNLTTIVLPFDTPATVDFYKTDADAFEPYDDGVVKVSDDTYTIVGDVTGDSITAGVNYEFDFTFSTQYLREETPEGEGAIQDGRLQLRYMSVIYTDSSYFEAHVTPTIGATRVTVFNGRTLADPDNVTDLIPRDTGEFRFPIFGENENVTVQLKSDQPYRCAFGSVEWSAIFKPKARRVK